MLVAGVTADALGVRAAIWLVVAAGPAAATAVAATAASGIVVAVRMYEARHPAAALVDVPA